MYSSDLSAENNYIRFFFFLSELNDTFKFLASKNEDFFLKEDYTQIPSLNLTSLVDEEKIYSNKRKRLNNVIQISH